MQNFVVDKPEVLFNNPTIRFENIPRRCFLNEASLKGIELTLFDDIFISPSQDSIQAIGFWHKDLMASYGIHYDELYCKIGKHCFWGNVATYSSPHNPYTFLQSPCGQTTQLISEDFAYSRNIGIAVITFPYDVTGQSRLDLEIVAGNYRKAFSLVPQKLSQHYFAIQTMLRSEPHRALLLREWIEYHLHIGVDRFYIYDNGIDCLDRDILDQYEAVKVVDWNKTAHHWHEYDKTGTRFKLVPMTQSQASTHCLYKYGKERQCQWLAHIDIDEFIISERSSVLDVLNSMLAEPSLSGVRMSQYVFYGKPPNEVKSVVRDCTLRAERIDHTVPKLIIRPELFDIVDVHCARQTEAATKTWSVRDSVDLRLNHYKHIFKHDCRVPETDGVVVYDPRLADLFSAKTKKTKSGNNHYAAEERNQ